MRSGSPATPPDPGLRGGYDVIVVGAGSAGCVVAAKLAADRARRVLLIEAGPDHRSNVTPALRDGWGLPRGEAWPYDWGYAAEPDASGETVPLRRGRVVGGTSWLTRFAVRGAPSDFDGWATGGLDGWSFDDILPSFRRIERDLEFGEAPWHGATGPLPITRYPGLDPTPPHLAAIEALAASGFDRVDDANRPGALGIARMPMSSFDGRRVSAADAFLPLKGLPPNLQLRADAQVANLAVERGRARGVGLADGTTIAADVVVVCAGTYGSPSILLRSGIGPAADLTALGIAVAADLPGVGANLADHPAVEIETGWSGVSRSAPVLHSIAPWHSSAAADPSPDLLFWLTDPLGEPAALTMECVLMRPASRGRVRLRSADPADPPRISLPRPFEPIDVERLAEGAVRAADIAQRPALRAICDGEVTSLPTERAALQAWVIENAYSVPHVTGTCAAGVSAEAGAVVDATGRVHGIDGLWVVDASILPGPPSGFPNLVTMAIADRTADMIAREGGAP